MPSKKKRPLPKRATVEKIKLPLMCLVTLVIVVVLAYIFRSWVRETVVPKTAGIFYASNLSKTLDNQSSSLNKPLTALGLGSITTKKSCLLELAQGVHEEVDCQALMQGYAVLPHNLQNEEQQAGSIQAHLYAAGWHGGSNGVTLMSLVGGMAKGIDWSADANYEKVVDKNKDCVLDVMIAYSNPQPPAIRATLSCDRTSDVFGAPKGQFYSSSMGYM